MLHAHVAELPYVTAKSLTTQGKIRTLPEDFRVEEIPAYPPAGHGTHLFVQFEKRNLTTREAVARLAEALAVDARDAGTAGQKDKVAVTTQWASLAGADADKALALTLPELRVLAAVPHPHKLRTGHVQGNRFVLRIREAHDDAAASEVLRVLSEIGVPNYYGEQRFGAGERNVARAHAMLSGQTRPPRDRFERKMLMSVMQSVIFNDWLATRIRDDLYAVPILGDVLRKEDSGGIFVNEDDDDALRRMQAWEVSPTGPMFGAKMRPAAAEALTREQVALTNSGLELEHFARHAKLGEGTRRAARIRPRNWTVDREPGALVLGFELPAGAYATAVLREIMKVDG